MKKIFGAVIVAASLTTAAVAAAQAVTTKAVGSVSVYFSPGGGAEGAVVDEVRAAQHRILVQAYSFTSPPIYKALAEAKARGVDVRVLVDKEARSPDFRGTGARYDLQHGVQVAVDEIPGKGIAHNKVMVIDGGTVITGSFNFSRQAETTNAENLVVFKNSPDLVRAYTQNWSARAARAQPY
ncbi:phospholipase D family protein [Burkholderia multivorans]|uniref:phospholipase D family nuclease n=1 Tax=Burkholderia cepacia complex TaxID=87882 RepID=UPI000D00A2EC|nr:MULTISPECIES: phospholipase D family protein [Burkholderia cepacia complex]MBR8373961.1 phospholipase D family protein [Burkholderia cenocepacia]MBR8443055.1 phospholipase D family protein [Burkholderia cenocepacia]MBU9122913.1 phospholipase D family protein [Burkholderia multivorans]MBU9236646.1 phospholipase D family protein [Burkholderia multivorans]MDN7867583.1 phospholipase D family protein [Burkholderia multivorans]